MKYALSLLGFLIAGSQIGVLLGGTGQSHPAMHGLFLGFGCWLVFAAVVRTRRDGSDQPQDAGEAASHRPADEAG